MHSLAPKMDTTSVFIKTLMKTHWGNEDCWERAENRGRRPRAGWVRFLGRGQQAPPARGSGSTVSSPAGFGAEP